MRKPINGNDGRNATRELVSASPQVRCSAGRNATQELVSSPQITGTKKAPPERG